MAQETIDEQRVLTPQSSRHVTAPRHGPQSPQARQQKHRAAAQRTHTYSKCILPTARCCTHRLAVGELEVANLATEERVRDRGDRRDPAEIDDGQAVRVRQCAGVSIRQRRGEWRGSRHGARSACGGRSDREVVCKMGFEMASNEDVKARKQRDSGIQPHAQKQINSHVAGLAVPPFAYTAR